ncbi:zinc ribbon domain-containing protein [Pseudomaricurvus alcaniphilus]|uniref:FmdB family zinc ribbon protein n=1 Tax=Pseudomaricurvus alcaniphilus TaxID=1166482 RepID=UPI001407B711|nr:zinc ribbon domain-containing protein [Pseudomaricurvus alcaniphilus]NHN37929.1 zinc ribbon domain-containing protein [Pseudomaricurvus alcaniphilus]
MPIYEYACRECGHELEALQKMSDPALTDCPECGKPGLNKKVSAAGFRLAGSGWYETDFKTGAKKKNLHSSSDTAGTAKSSDSGSPAAKPAAAPAAKPAAKE